ncbi:MAG: DUF3108 domain-containing protein [Paludibacteraceae bacterium]|nr:DUF3108 domain-containing protein [Paludibacteraceae bacterium]
MKKIALIILLALTRLVSWAADVEYYSEPVFKVGEKATFNLYYNWGFVWIHAGDVHFKTQERTYNNEKAIGLLVAGTSTSTFDKMYCIRDSFESYVNPATMRPVFYREAKHEDSYFAALSYTYSEKNNGVDAHMHRYKRRKLDDKHIALDKNTSDLIYSCYNFRNLNTEKLAVNQTVPFNMLFDDDIYNLGLTFKGKTTVKLKNGKKYNALKFVPKLITGDLFKKENDMVIYVSDDMNHVPLLIEAKIKVGSVKAMLADYTNAKYPITSLIK